MKIDFSVSGFFLDPRLTQDIAKKDMQSSPQGDASVLGKQLRGTEEFGAADGDRVELGATSSNGLPTKATYDMSDLKKKADTRLRELRPPTDGIRPLLETHLGSTRESLVEMAKKRMEEGFYSRPDVIDEIARRLAEEF